MSVDPTASTPVTPSFPSTSSATTGTEPFYPPTSLPVVPLPHAEAAISADTLAAMALPMTALALSSHLPTSAAAAATFAVSSGQLASAAAAASSTTASAAARNENSAFEDQLVSLQALYDAHKDKYTAIDSLKTRIRSLKKKSQSTKDDKQQLKALQRDFAPIESQLKTAQKQLIKDVVKLAKTDPGAAVRLLALVDIHNKDEVATEVLKRLKKDPEALSQLLRTYINHHIATTDNPGNLFRQTESVLNTMLKMVLVDKLAEEGVFRALQRSIAEHVQRGEFGKLESDQFGGDRLSFNPLKTMNAAHNVLMDMVRVFQDESRRSSFLTPILREIRTSVAGKWNEEEANKQVVALVVLRVLNPVLENTEGSQRAYNPLRYSRQEEANARATAYVAQAIVNGNWLEVKDKRLEHLIGEGGPIHRTQGVVRELCAALIKTS